MPVSVPKPKPKLYSCGEVDDAADGKKTCTVLRSFVHRRLCDVIADVTSCQLVIDCHTPDKRPRSPGSVPWHRHIQVGPETVQLSLVTGSAARTDHRRRMEDLIGRMDYDRVRPEWSVQHHIKSDQIHITRQ